MKRPVIWIMAALLAQAVYLPGGAAAEEKRKLGIMEVYSLARERDAIYGASRAARDAGVEKAEQGRAALLPSVRVDAGVTATDQNVTYKGTNLLKGGHSSYNGDNLAVSLSQPVFRMGNLAMYRQGEATADMAETAFGLAGQDLIQRTAVAYFNVLLAQNSIELIGAQKEAISERLARAKKSFEVGTASITDTHEAQARFDLTASREIMARQNLEIAGEELSKIIGERSFELAPLKEEFTPEPPAPGDIDFWAEEAEKKSPYLQIKRKSHEIAVQETAKAKGDRLPVADLLASYSYLNQGGSNFGMGMENTTQTLNLRVSLPLYAGGALSSKVREAQANEEKARQELEEARRQVRLWARSAYMRALSAQAEVNALRQAFVSSKSALSSTQQGFEVGLRSAVDVLDAQQLYFDARQALAQAKYNYLLSLLRLDAAVGSLGEEGLRKVSRYLAF